MHSVERAMLNLLYVSLEAHNPTRNHHRGYAVQLNCDLLSTWVVESITDHTGCNGRTTLHAFDSLDDAREKVRTSVQSRVSTPR